MALPSPLSCLIATSLVTSLRVSELRTTILLLVCATPTPLANNPGWFPFDGDLAFFVPPPSWPTPKNRIDWGVRCSSHPEGQSSSKRPTIPLCASTKAHNR